MIGLFHRIIKMKSEIWITCQFVGLGYDAVVCSAFYSAYRWFAYTAIDIVNKINL